MLIFGHAAPFESRSPTGSVSVVHGQPVLSRGGGRSDKPTRVIYFTILRANRYLQIANVASKIRSHTWSMRGSQKVNVLETFPCILMDVPPTQNELRYLQGEF